MEIDGAQYKKKSAYGRREVCKQPEELKVVQLGLPEVFVKLDTD